VSVCTFSGWVQTFPTWTKKTREAARCLLKEMIPVSIGLDNWPAFVVEVVQVVTKGLGITWNLHMAYCPQVQEKWNV
jgi:hypothetical protein